MLCFIVHGHGDRRYLHSFPTRRSSDLQQNRLAVLRLDWRAEQERGPQRRLDDAADRTHEQIAGGIGGGQMQRDRKSTRLNSSHLVSSYAVFCLRQKMIEVNTGAVALNV